MCQKKSNNSLIFPARHHCSPYGLLRDLGTWLENYGNSWKALLGSVKGIDKSQLEPTKLCLRDMGNLSLIWGILGTFVGAILMLREMESVLNQNSLIPAIAISLITLFYGIILYMLCLVSKSRIERRLVE